MFDDQARRSLRQTAKRGGAVSAGALVVMVAGGSFALAGSGSGATGGLASPTAKLTSPAHTPTALPTGALPVPQPQTAPVPAPVKKVVTTATGTAGTLTTTVKKIVQTLTTKPNPVPVPNPGPNPGPAPDPGPVDNGGGGGGGLGGGNQSHQPPKVTHTGTTAGHPAGQATHRSSVTHQAASVQLRIGGLADNAGNFAEQRTNASVTPGLAPRATDSIFPAAGLGGSGVPGVLIVIATAGVAALGASHLGIWYNRRVVSVPTS
jgi:hypothetical protein